MYIDLQTNGIAAGLGYFRAVNAAAELAEFYPPPYDSVSGGGGLGNCGAGCACDGCGDQGLGSWLDALGPFGSLSSISDTLGGDSPVSGVPSWLLWGGLGLGVLLIFNSGSQRSELSKARIDYENRVHSIRERHSIRSRARQARKLIPRVSVSR